MPKKSIALIWMKSTFLSRTDVFPPLGLFYLASQLESQGHRCEYFDLNFDELPQDGDFDQIWFSATSPQMAEIKRIARETSSWTKTRTVLGGAAAWADPNSVKDLGFDLVVGGEGDHPESVAKTIEIADNKSIPYILYPISRNLEWLLPPERRWSTRYVATMYDHDERPYRMATLFTSRGCALSCAFCESGRHGVIWDRLVRYESIDVVEKQIKECVDLGFTGIAYYDDVYILNKKRTLQMLEIQKKYGIKFRCFLRTDILIKHGGKSYLQQLLDGGLIEIFVGVESADNNVKAAIHKGTTIEQDTDVLRWCRALGIRMKASFILGLPSESMDSMKKTRDWILKYRPDRVQVGRLVPFRGTPLHSRREEYDLKYEEQPPDEWFYSGNAGEGTRSFVSTSHLTRDEIDVFWHELMAELKREGIPS